MTLLKIIVDRELCETNGLCVSTAPSSFAIEDDTLRVLSEQPSAAQLASVREAVRRCPRGALSLVEHD